ncbi:MAG: redoxin family protein [Blastocatellia bacterium]|nr:redoxin family protein [Blastocatellia bacterium]
MKALLLTTLLLLSVPLNAQKALKEEPDHKLVTFQPHKLDYKNFTFPSSVEGRTIDLREQAKGKKLVLVTYFAAWCENSSHDYETLKHLLKKFGDRGLGVVGVCNYSEPKEVKEFITKHHPDYPIAMETSDDKQRENTSHYRYRKLCGDARKWGTPFTLLIEGKNIKADGEILTNEILAANGEMDRKEAEKLLKQLLK